MRKSIQVFILILAIVLHGTTMICAESPDSSAVDRTGEQAENELLRVAFNLPTVMPPVPPELSVGRSVDRRIPYIPNAVAPNAALPYIPNTVTSKTNLPHIPNIIPDTAMAKNIVRPLDVASYDRNPKRMAQKTIDANNMIFKIPGKTFTAKVITQ
jgi:hypothetical protein